MVQNIDAAVFQRMMIHAHAAINAQKQPINDLNVFPVPVAISKIPRYPKDTQFSMASF